MNDQDKTNLCHQIRQQVGNFILEWKANPNLWLQEIDVQCDLTHRIRILLQGLGLDIILAPHSHYRMPYEFSRVTCEPYISLGTGKRDYAHPDIVVWDDPPQMNGSTLNSGRWPIIWACEIKYTTGEPTPADYARLQRLLQNNTLFAGCWIKLMVNTPRLMPRPTSIDPKLWIFEESVSIQ